ncbi:MAG: TolC family outer membrane protein [Immundisolibacter sp.]|uniref:TolC family outer membrane protein n=1 Tax=Immundisolibacter sp. TaxID=1934948 RepID=UPI003EE3C294
MKRHILLVGLASALLTLPVAAEDLLAVYRQALQNDAQLQAAEAARDAARELKPQALSFVLPNVQSSAQTSKNTLRTDSFGAFPPGGTADFNAHSWQVQAVQPLFNWQLIAGLGQADALVRQADNQYRFAEQELMLRTSSRYFGVLSAADNLRFVESEKAAIGRQLEQAKQRFEVGLIAITDIHEAQARYDLTVAQEIEARNELTNAMEALREVTGTGYETLTPLTHSLPLEPPAGESAEIWVTQALDQNPLVAAASEATTAAKKEVERLRAGHFPTLDATATYLNSSAAASRFGAGSDGEDTIYGLQMKLPLFEGGRTSSRVRQAQQQYRQAQQHLEQQRRATSRETRDAYLGVVAAISRVRAFRQAQVSNESALEATELGYRVGTRTSVDALDAERELYRAKRNLATARYDYVLNGLRLEQASGQLSEEDLARVNGWLDEAAAGPPPPVAP